MSIEDKYIKVIKSEGLKELLDLPSGVLIYTKTIQLIEKEMKKHLKEIERQNRGVGF